MMDELGFVRETLARIEGKVDALGQQLAAVVTDHATLATRVAGLEKSSDTTLATRVLALEKAGDRRWALVPTWVASAVAIVLAAYPYLHH
jgi:type VI protein secretion system component VasF